MRARIFSRVMQQGQPDDKEELRASGKEKPVSELEIWSSNGLCRTGSQGYTEPAGDEGSTRERKAMEGMVGG